MMTTSVVMLVSLKEIPLTDWMRPRDSSDAAAPSGKQKPVFSLCH